MHPLQGPPDVMQRQEFALPAAALADSTSLELEWSMAPDAGGSGMGSYVAEVLLHRAANGGEARLDAYALTPPCPPAPPTALKFPPRFLQTTQDGGGRKGTRGTE